MTQPTVQSSNNSRNADKVSSSEVATFAPGMGAQR